VGHFFRFVREIRPRFFIMENVPGILADPFGPILRAYLNDLATEYRIVGPLTLDAASLGAATHRRRVILLGVQPDHVNTITEADVLQLARFKGATVREAIADLAALSVVEKTRNGDFVARHGPFQDEEIAAYARQARSAPLTGLGSSSVREAYARGLVTGLAPTHHTPSVIERFAKIPPGSRDEISWFPRLSWDKPGPTLLAGTGKTRGSFQAVRPIHPSEPRVINVREAARLQGFPDWFLFHPTKWHSFRMLGNSVSPYVSEALLRLLRARLDDSRCGNLSRKVLPENGVV
jgi:DNA (cytosine-5)-methyltransferase 1